MPYIPADIDQGALPESYGDPQPIFPGYRDGVHRLELAF